MITELLDDATNIADEKLTPEEYNLLATLTGNVTGCIIETIKKLDPVLNITMEEIGMLSVMVYKVAILAYDMGINEVKEE
jgi:hypothetical protein